eukprot:CAMPEP_0118892864 /NCGR_PEP_ID=MMETSP1166-20130328/2299_1 /TAXON_ID=1104430 /ORGANISM="Chrysoreinhardia sp, Strain CCMP3193" /LENGTH=194 /DNA_ID=CAMNT_0006831623 /DNA_START=96 /DNA_END=677 /DNA_ORIENTATION=+
MPQQQTQEEAPGSKGTTGRQQALSMLEEAQMARTKEEKARKIGELTEVALYRQLDAAVVSDLVAGVSEQASDGSAAVRKSVVGFLAKVAASAAATKAVAKTCVETCAFVISTKDAASSTVAASGAACATLRRWPKEDDDVLGPVARERLLEATASFDEGDPVAVAEAALERRWVVARRDAAFDLRAQQGAARLR